MTKLPRTGLDRWIAGDESCDLPPAESTLGLIVHGASVDRRAIHLLEWAAAANLRVERIFSPEHGLWGVAQDMESVSGAHDPLTGAPVISLYGDTVESLRPTVGQLDGLDALVVDLQDVGSRYYTFVYTLAMAMETAAEAGIPVWVLDRPNPLGGNRVEGPVLKPEWISFVGRFELPVVHGLTIGELAGRFQEANPAPCELHVVPLEGYRRDLDFRETRLPWVPPSPNMPALSTARVYPGGCLIEGTTLSEGRGTTTPFELVGAPGIDEMRLASELRKLGLPGVAFRPCQFRPQFQKHANVVCSGVQILEVEPERFRPFECFLALLSLLRREFAGTLTWRTEPYEFEHDRLAIDLLLGRGDLRPMLEDGASLEEMESTWRAGLDAFRESRRPSLLY